MNLAFVDRIPTAKEVERLRLILSTFQDGTGMLVDKKNKGRTLPGWRDFERSVALAFGGEAQESKAVFDVLLSNPTSPHMKYGISCKMRGELNRIERDGRVTVELSNSAGKFWQHLQTKGIDQSNYREKPSEVGVGLVELVTQWHVDAKTTIGVEIDRSSYLVLSWNREGWYQLYQFSLNLVSPEVLKWSCPVTIRKGKQELARRIVGHDDSGILLEWYGESGGQLKYYPSAVNAIWASERFRLEPLRDLQSGILAKVAAYFPDLWQTVQD